MHIDAVVDEMRTPWWLLLDATYGVMLWVKRVKVKGEVGGHISYLHCLSTRTVPYIRKLRADRNHFFLDWSSVIVIHPHPNSRHHPTQQ